MYFDSEGPVHHQNPWDHVWHRVEDRWERPNGATGDQLHLMTQAMEAWFFGDVEAVFGIWVIVLAGAITWHKGWPEVVGYISGKVSYIEPIFVVVIMALAATRP